MNEILMDSRNELIRRYKLSRVYTVKPSSSKSEDDRNLKAIHRDKYKSGKVAEFSNLIKSLDPEVQRLKLSTILKFLVELPDVYFEGKLNKFLKEKYDEVIEKTFNHVIKNPEHKVSYDDELGKWTEDSPERQKQIETSSDLSRKIGKFLEMLGELRKIDIRLEKERGVKRVFEEGAEADFREDIEAFLKAGKVMGPLESITSRDMKGLQKAVVYVTQEHLNRSFEDAKRRYLKILESKKPESEFFEFGDQAHAKDHKQRPQTERSSRVQPKSAAKYVPHSKMLDDVFSALRDVYKKISPRGSSGLLYDDDYFRFMTDAKPQRDYIDKRDQSQKRFTSFVHAYGLMQDKDREKFVDLINKRIKEDRFKLDPKAGIMKIQTSISKITDEDLEEIEKEIGKGHFVSYGEYWKQR